MDMPVLLHGDLAYVKDVENEEELLKTLIERHDHLIFFLEIASDDSYWRDVHKNFFQKSFIWLTEQFFYGRLSLEYAKRLRQLIHLHSEEFSQLALRDISIVIEDTNYQVNSLLFACASPLFYEYIWHYCMELRKRKFIIEDFSNAYFDDIIEYVHTGTVADLWKREMLEVLAIIRAASSWKVLGLDTLAAETFAKYLNRETAIHYLKYAQEHALTELKCVCMDHIHALDLGFEFYHRKSEFLGMKFNRYNYLTSEIFEEFKQLMTHVSFRDLKIEQTVVDKIIEGIPHLIGVDFCHTELSLGDSLTLPSTLQELDLSVCSWLSPGILEAFVQECPEIRHLKLKHNLHLNHQFWQQIKFEGLESLDVALCNQITDEDVMMIASVCSTIQNINLEGCKLISDQGIAELAKNLSKLVSINLSATTISEAAVAELIFHCPHLKYIKIKHCKNVSENFQKKYSKYFLPNV